jgi:hypothetical protein
MQKTRNSTYNIQRQISKKYFSNPNPYLIFFSKNFWRATLEFFSNFFEPRVGLEKINFFIEVLEC